MRTAQELFDTSVNGLRTQNKVAAQGNYCQYRGADGTKCAVGWLIPDEEYKPEMECGTIGTLLDNRVLPRNLQEEFSINADLLRTLQKVHDNTVFDPSIKSNPATYWEPKFAEVATKFGLTYTPPQS
jgi:hypothetical protein